MNTRLVRALGVIMFAASVILTNGLPVKAQSGGMRDASFDGVTFRYDASLAGGVTAKLVPETVGGDDGFWWMASPQHIEFDFSDFHQAGFPAAIYILPVRSDYSSLTPAPGYNQDFWLQSVQGLQRIISRQPDLHTAIEQSMTAPGVPPYLPYLPPINAATTVIGKPGYERFQNGLGIRYLVEIAQDVAPPDHDNTGYTFQGLTSDGKYYVAAFFPAFPTTMQPIPLFQGDDTKDYNNYNLNLIDRFDAISNDGYTPNLDLLDKMMGSLSVHPTQIDVLPGMPGTGESADGVMLVVLLVLAISMVFVGGALFLRSGSRAS